MLFSLLLTQEHPSIHQLQSQQKADTENPPVEKAVVFTGLDVLLDQQPEKIRGKSIALVTNQTGLDKQGVPNYKRLMELEGVRLKIIFPPEHGLFGEAAAGEIIEYSGAIEELPVVISLYGKTKKPTPEMLDGIDLVLYDIQDIGARFYTYISTMGLVMEAAGELGIPVIILDRPNPIRGDRIEGPLLDMEYRSFVGFYPILIKYGLTVGELAQMIVCEKWIEPIPELEISRIRGWKRNLWYDETDLPWIKPSPNIPDLETAIIYPGICLIEGTNVSEGRGTYHPFKWIGAPWISGKQLAQRLNNLNLPGVVFKPIRFTPVEIPEMASKPKYEGEPCSGVEIILIDRNLYESISTGIHIISVLHNLYPEHFQFRSYLNKLWGSDKLIRQINAGVSPGEIIESDKEIILEFVKKYEYYLLYQ